MSLLKNTFGVSIEFQPRVSKLNFLDKLAGSSLERPVKVSLMEKGSIEQLLATQLKMDDDDTAYKLRSMSARSKSKIRKKVIAFARLQKKLSFVTLTFVNQVTDRQGIKVLGAFLDNAIKRSRDLQYLWVAEKQSKNELYKDNIHFHLITNKFWKIDKWWPYWLEVQKRYGIVPRDENFKPSSAFDVKHVNSNNIKGVVNYLTKYVTKNSGQFACQVWNCSRKISQLYTDFYSEPNFLKHLERLAEINQLGGKIQSFQQEHCNIHLIPLNNKTINFYNRIDEKNKTIWSIENTKGGNQ